MIDITSWWVVATWKSQSAVKCPRSQNSSTWMTSTVSSSELSSTAHCMTLHAKPVKACLNKRFVCVACKSELGNAQRTTKLFSVKCFAPCASFAIDVTWSIRRDFRNCLNVSRESITISIINLKENEKLSRMIFFVFHFFFKCAAAEGRKKHEQQTLAEKKKSFTRDGGSPNAFLRERTAEPRLWFLSFPFVAYPCLQFTFDA